MISCSSCTHQYGNDTEICVVAFFAVTIVLHFYYLRFALICNKTNHTLVNIFKQLDGITEFQKDKMPQ